ncbi:general secretion pathway protein GspE [Vitiosangium sp. GDMCC 1.1324]|uniref:GspE/PulE/PilB domain-containing protein n=1 Tax=Vitiosangium sp. (strain GDMCC 1.1324) TaxID=2138576 RepID=UPI000D380BDD|nr:general secretion pathway protein GspE [Vitiosangium sp. GDMCC 1.1324]PTL76411.1 general secretion pathway protein GspE [Vitiosangium sp. GDMCC 1.1324]
MAAPRNRIGEILVKARVIDEMQLRSALAQHDQWGGRLSRIITDMGLVAEDTITQAISQGLGVQRVQLGTAKDPGALAKVDVGFAEQKSIFPVSLRDNGKTLVLAMADPTDLQTIDQVAARSRTRVIPMVAGDREIQNAILRHYRNQDPAVSHSAHPASRRESAGGDEDEFKIVDISGKTVMKALSDIAPNMAKENAARQAGPATTPAPVPSRGGGGASAADLLDEILSSAPSPAEVFSPEEMQRLQAVQVNQEKSSKILRALLELLLEKRTIQQRELAARMRPS